MRGLRPLLCISCAALLLGTTACNNGGGGSNKAASTATSKFSADVAVQWMNLLYDVVKSQGLNPPKASRAYGYAGVTLYEAVVNGMKSTHQSLVGQLLLLDALPTPANASYYWPSVANAALPRLLLTLITGLTQPNIDLINALETSFNTQFAVEASQATIDRSITFGQAIADAILAWAATDGLAEYENASYTPPTGPGLWVPTPPAFLPPLLPYWGLMRPFVLLPASECPPGVPPAYSTDPASAFYLAAQEVYTVTGISGANLSADQHDIAVYWGDGPVATGTPAGHWWLITGQLITDQARKLDFAAEAYARLGIAVRDAFISCWQAKFQFNLLRPITYIPANIDPLWLPLLPTPNFPSYASGHSTQSGASTTVLEDLFGIVAFTDRSHVEHDPNIVVLLNDTDGMRDFTSLSEAADEAAQSRLYGGIHYMFDNNDGLAGGRCVGQTILDRVKFKKP